MSQISLRSKFVVEFVLGRVLLCYRVLLLMSLEDFVNVINSNTRLLHPQAIRYIVRYFSIDCWQICLPINYSVDVFDKFIFPFEICKIIILLQLTLQRR